MTFEQREESIESGIPIELYKFVTGPGPNDVIGYTDAEHDIERGGVIYKSIPIDRDAIKVTGTLDKAALEISMPKDTEIAELFRIFPPSYVIAIIIYQGHHNDLDGEFLVSWTGHLMNCKFEGIQVRLTCSSLVGSLQRPGLRRNYQYACPHVLYGPSCRAPKVPRALHLISKVNGNTLLVSHASPLGAADEKFITGTIEWFTDDGRKEIRNIVGVQRVGLDLRLTIGGSVASAIVASEMSMYLGCDHKMETCSGVFNNILNYGGQPWIPLKNPVGVSSPFI